MEDKQIVDLYWARSETAIAETENAPQYKEKIIKILDALFEGNESDFIVGIRNKASK